MPKYDKFEKRPIHPGPGPLTGRPADYYWLNDRTGERYPRWKPIKEIGTPTERWYSTAEAAALMGRDVQTVRGYIAGGKLPAGRPPSSSGKARWMIRGDDLVAFIRARNDLTLNASVAEARLR